MSDLVYGVVANGVWYSNRSESKIRGVENGIYSIDTEADDFWDTITPANIEDARKFFSKASKVRLIRGVSFHDGIIPEDPVKYPKIPIKVEDPTYDEFEEIEVAILKGKMCYFLQVVYGEKSYALMDAKVAFEAKKTLDGIKGLTPDIRIASELHWFDRKQEEIREARAKWEKEMLEPQNAIKSLMGEGGATVDFVKKNNRGFEVQWTMSGYTINTQLDKDYRVSEAGFCVSNWDGTQSARSLVHLLDEYTTDGYSYVNRTRTVKREE